MEIWAVYHGLDLGNYDPITYIYSFVKADSADAALEMFNLYASKQKVCIYIQAELKNVRNVKSLIINP